MSGTHGVFQHRSGYFYTILEEDFCEVYKSDGNNEVCRAYITSILENLTNKQFEATGNDTDIWVFMSIPEMARRMRHAFSARTIHKELQGMVKEGFLAKRRATGTATMEYKLNLKRLRKALEALPDRQSCRFARYNLANLQDQSGKSARSTLQNYKNDLADLQPRISNRLQEDYLKITEQERVASPHVDATAPAFSENENEYHILNDREWHLIWNCQNWCAAHDNATCADYQAYIDSGEREETPTEPRTPIVTIGATDATTLAPSDHVHSRGDSTADLSDSSTDQRTQRQIAIASTPGGAVAPPTAAVRQSYTSSARVASSAPTEARSSHERNDGAATEVGSEPAPSGKRRGKKVPQAPPELSPRVVQTLDDWDSLHKKPVPRTEGNITAAQLLVEADATREEMKGCRDWLPTTDRPGKPWYRKIGVHLPDIAAKLEQYRSLADMPPETRAPLADKARKNIRDVQYEAALEKTGQRMEDEEVPAWLDFDNYVGNGPEARQRLVEEGRLLKAQGFCPDL